MARSPEVNPAGLSVTVAMIDKPGPDVSGTPGNLPDLITEIGGLPENRPDTKNRAGRLAQPGPLC
jgi:hypothetical protein